MPHWTTPSILWQKLKPMARQMRAAPTPAEDALWQRLRNHRLGGLGFRRQHPLEGFILDFYCKSASLVVEVDGPIHEYSTEDDRIRQKFIERHGLRVLRFSNEEVVSDLERVLRDILSACETSSPSPFTGRGSGGGVASRATVANRRDSP